MRFGTVLEAARRYNASDIHLVAGAPPALRVDGEVVLTERGPLAPAEIKETVDSILTDDQQRTLEREKELCFSHFDERGHRARVSVYYSAGHVELCARLSEERVKSIEELNLPAHIESVCWMTRGLVVITGPTGMGKTTTMNYIIDRINTQRRCKIITIEDPVEFTHTHKRSIVVQQEVRNDVLSFNKALVHALRQNPDVIAVGEMRDLDTIQTAITAAETGHLVLATLHTPDTTQTVDRIIGVFPAHQQDQVRLQFANSLQMAVSQKLLPTASERGRALACEILVATMAVRSVIREGHVHKLYSIIQTGQAHRMQTMDAALLGLYMKGEITYDTALNHAAHPEFIEKRSGRTSQDEAVEGNGASRP